MSAGERIERIRVRHNERNSGPGAPTASTIRPDGRPQACDRRVGVGHQLRDDLYQIDPALREVLTEVAPAYDVRHGLLTRELRFRDRGVRETSLRSRRFVSMGRMHLSAVAWELVAEN